MCGTTRSSQGITGVLAREKTPISRMRFEGLGLQQFNWHYSIGLRYTGSLLSSDLKKFYDSVRVWIHFHRKKVYALSPRAENQQDGVWCCGSTALVSSFPRQHRCIVASKIKSRASHPKPPSRELLPKSLLGHLAPNQNRPSTPKVGRVFPLKIWTQIDLI